MCVVYPTHYTVVKLEFAPAFMGFIGFISANVRQMSNVDHQAKFLYPGKRFWDKLFRHVIFGNAIRLLFAI